MKITEKIQFFLLQHPICIFCTVIFLLYITKMQAFVWFLYGVVIFAILFYIEIIYEKIYDKFKGKTLEVNMKKTLIFILGVVFGAVFLGNGFYAITSAEHGEAYILNKYTKTVFCATPSRIEKVDYRK